MKKKLLTRLHQGLLVYLVLGGTVGLLSLLSWNWQGMAAFMAFSTPIPAYLMAVWFLCLLYFLGCLAMSHSFRERFITKLAGFTERDEREELITARAARATFLLSLATFLALGLASSLRINVFAYNRYQGPAPTDIPGTHPWPTARPVASGFMMWPSLGLPLERFDNEPPFDHGIKDGHTKYFVAHHSLIDPEFPRIMFACALLQVLFFHLFARRLKL